MCSFVSKEYTHFSQMRETFPFGDSPERLRLITKHVFSGATNLQRKFDSGAVAEII